jgi:hypothetical protein
MTQIGHSARQARWAGFATTRQNAWVRDYCRMRRLHMSPRSREPVASSEPQQGTTGANRTASGRLLREEETPTQANSRDGRNRFLGAAAERGRLAAAAAHPLSRLPHSEPGIAQANQVNPDLPSSPSSQGAHSFLSPVAVRSRGCHLSPRRAPFPGADRPAPIRSFVCGTRTTVWRGAHRRVKRVGGQ